MKCYVYVVKLIEANIAKMLGDARWNVQWFWLEPQKKMELKGSMMTR